jgi:PKD repeat protein
MKRITLLLAIVIATAFTFQSQAQISQGGTPPGIIFQMDDDYPVVELSQPDMEEIILEDKFDEAAGGPGPRRMGVSVMVNKALGSIGKWTTLPDGSKILRAQLYVPGALALGVYYDDFFLPEGTELFLYNGDKKQILGAYTSDNNPESHLFSTQFVQGDRVTLEYHQPAGVTDKPRIHISELAYAYRDIDFMFKQDRSSWWCMINVACEEGDNWENQIKSVARISIKIGFNYYWCSGGLINNTENDRTPYFLTAAHCGEGSSAGDMNQWVFYFNYQASTCNGTTSNYNTMNGCQLKANDASAADAGSDFYLVELNNTIPQIYDVFYSGWNRTNSNVEADSGVGIHHPAGDIKKISTYKTPIQSSTFWNGLPSHWKIVWAETKNGKSIMQGGSSGSPIFDQYGRIVGDLTGGYASNSCTNPSPAYYGKIWYSWDQNGTTSAHRLKDWLDPNNKGYEKLGGVSWKTILPTCDFEADTTTVMQTDTVFFTDLSGPEIYIWDWQFTGGEPDTSDERNPYTVYSDTGYFDVTLTVTNGDGTDTETKTAYIHVVPMPAPVADFSSDITVVAPGNKVHFYDESTGDPNSWNWEFEGGSPSTSTVQDPIVRYSTAGVYNVKLVATNNGGSDTIVKTGYITCTTAQVPVVDFEADNNTIMQGESVNFTDLSTNDPDTWHWTFDGGTPETSTEQNPQGIVYPEGGSYNVKLVASNEAGYDSLVKEEYIHVNWVGIGEFDGPHDFHIFPNPGNGLFVVEFATTGNTPATIEVVDSFGKLIRKYPVTKSDKHITLDLKALSNGNYFIKLNDGIKTVTRQITIVK